MQEAYSQSILYYPLARWESDRHTENVAFRNNRTPNGRPVYPILVDWYWNNTPRWGLPPDDGAWFGFR